MKKYLFVFSLVACTINVALPNQAFAVELYSAGSLRNSLTEITGLFTEDTGIPVTLTFNGSGTLADTIQKELTEKGKSADVFTSADIGNPQRLYDQGLSGPVVNFIGNRLVAVVRPGLNVTSDNLLNFLLDPNIKVGTSTPIKDPSGDYAFQVFDKAGQVKSGSTQILKDKALQLVGGNPNAPVLPNGENNLVYFLKKIPQEEFRADIFLSYYTGALSAQALPNGSDLQLIELPNYLATKADYGLTIVKNADPDSQKLADYILSPKAQDILINKYKFAPPSTPVPEPSSIGGAVLAVSIAFALKKRQAYFKSNQSK
ncbi:extracellular solute-binding protein [Nostoc sp. CHAB 5715]|uniref:extracellular solute-binding protein n=1 Tax=Nostoc sp. CHAB 5715 TaxID=2780400 RepID=UPI001E3C0347|nr:extracellular solute-binding protein [Nostoc sp. CHAB 5715]MCC5626129.1 extracellular solute-binding protein [Nostoc sp. CHAB 5715]